MAQVNKARTDYSNRVNGGRGPYVYPLNRNDQYESKITFQAIKVIPPEFTLSLKAPETGSDTGEEDGSLLDKAGEIESEGLTALKTKPLLTEKASIYLPIAFSVTDGLQYTGANLNGLGAAAMSGVNAGAGLGGSIFEGIKDAGKSIFDFFTGATGGEASRIGAVRAADFVPMPDSVKAGIQVAARVTMNPNVRSQFQGIDQRSFNFQFKFLPKSQSESIEVKRLIKFFRFHAYPEEIPYGKSFSIAFNYPNMFRIKLLSGRDGPTDSKGNKIFKHVGTPIKLCYLTNISTTYNPTAGVLHADGSPTEIDMALTFQEYKTISRFDINNEENDIYYQFENTGEPEGDGGEGTTGAGSTEQGIAVEIYPDGGNP